MRARVSAHDAREAGAALTAVAVHRFLTDKGIDHLREFLNLPEEIVPSTLKKSTRNLERGERCAAAAACLLGCWAALSSTPAAADQAAAGTGKS